jgi:hypothetical protein
MKTKTAIGDTALFKVTLVVAQRDFYPSGNPGVEHWTATAGEWLINLLTGVAEGQDMAKGAEDFLQSIIAFDEAELELIEKEKE